MSTLHWHKRYHSDALTGMMELTLEERGAYTTLLDMLYDRGEALVWNERLIAGHFGVSIRKARSLIESLIAKGKITVGPDGRLSNRRFEKERETELKTSRKRSENGAKGFRTKAEAAKKLNENNEAPEAPETAGLGDTRSQKLEARKEESTTTTVAPLGREGPLSSEPPPSRPDPIGPASPGVVEVASISDQVREAAGYDPGRDRPPMAWVDLNLAASIRRWRGLGLSDASILEAMQQFRPADRRPAASPKYYDRILQDIAAERSRTLAPISHGGPPDARSFDPRPAGTARERRAAAAQHRTDTELERFKRLFPAIGGG